MTSKTFRKALAIGGFTLIEALVAMAIGGFGLMAVARLQLGLQAESDLAKQLSEANFIGQQRIEQLRAFQQVAAFDATALAAGKWGYANIVTGTQSVTGSNAVYTVNWTISDAASGVPYKTAQVVVQWTDRQGGAQQALLTTAIAGTDPAAALGLGIPPVGTPIRRPKDRDLNVPVPAVDLGDGTSAFTPPGAAADLRLVFNNTTGLLTKRCTGSDSDPATWTCENIDGYLVSGYVGFGAKAVVGPGSAINLNFTLTEGTQSGCYDDSGATTPTYAGYITYTCVIIGSDHDSDAATRSRWSGRSDLAGLTIGSTKDDSKVCRYSADYNGNGVIDNSEHPASYDQVTESLENQNFLVVAGNDACPTGTLLETTVQHQPAPEPAP